MVREVVGRKHPPWRDGCGCVLACWLLVAVLASSSARAQELGAPSNVPAPEAIAKTAPAVATPPAPEPVPEPHYDHPFLSDNAAGKWRAVGLGALGVATGFLAHELGHVLMNLAYGNVPSFEGVRYAGFIPFFRISHGIQCGEDSCIDADGEPFHGGHSGAYMITAAGFNTQHLINEIVLSLDPELRYHRSPFAKGMLFFSIALSAGYALSTWAQIDPPMGDILGMHTVSGINPNWVALMVAIPAAIDLYRFFVPDSRWAVSVGRGSKLLFLTIGFAF